jgi:hypothetical protein
MSNKWILVPEDIYRGLTTSDTGDINLDFQRHSLDRVKRERVDPTTKNLNYNQELRRYLHLRKQHEDRPIRVTTEAPMQTPTPVNRTRRRRPALATTPVTATTARTAPGIGNEDEEDAMQTADEGTTPGLAAQHPTMSSAPSTSTPLFAPRQQAEKPRTPAKVYLSVDQFANELYAQMKQNPLRYPSIRTEHDYIVNDAGQQIKGSNLKNTLKYILRKKANIPVLIPKRPPGTSLIEQFFQGEDIVAEINKRKEQSGGGAHGKLPQKRYYKNTPTLAKKSISTFQPTLWKRK